MEAPTPSAATSAFLGGGGGIAAAVDGWWILGRFGALSAEASAPTSSAGREASGEMPSCSEVPGVRRSATFTPMPDGVRPAS